MLVLKFVLYVYNLVFGLSAWLLCFQGGAVLDRSLQPYEAHIPYILQFLVWSFMCDLFRSSSISELILEFFLHRHGIVYSINSREQMHLNLSLIFLS